MKIINYIFKFVSLSDRLLFLFGMVNFLISFINLSRNDMEKFDKYFERGMYCIYFSAFLSLFKNFCSKAGIFN